MCNLIGKSSRISFTGYKLAAKDDNGNYFSIAMGTQYDLNGNIRIPEIQKQIVRYFNNNILDKHVPNGYREYMIGRTAALVRLKDCKRFYSAICRWLTPDRMSVNYKLVIIKVKLTKKLMYGTYGVDFKEVKLIAGKHMQILKEYSDEETSKITVR